MAKAALYSGTNAERRKRGERSIKMEIFEGLTMETKGYLEIKFDYGTSIPEVGSVVLVTAIWKNKYNTWLDGKRWEYVQK